MSKVCRIQVNGETFSANRGDLLLDAALMNGIELPHDCRSGYCGTCRVRIVDGRAFGGSSNEPDVVHACQCRIITDLAIAVDEIPEATETPAVVSGITQLAPDVVEVCIEPIRPVTCLPGQYISVQFRGFPARRYSPTAPLDWPTRRRGIRIQVRQIANGRVSSALGRKIVAGHRVKLKGPLGSAYLRPNHPGRLVLISSGTGFAPIWAIAEAAIWERPGRDMVLIVGARSVESFYMIPALCRLALFPNVTIISVVSEPQSVTRAIQQGRPTDYLPKLHAHDDIVYAAGAPGMVEAVTRLANAAGVRCFSDPFTPEPGDSMGMGLGMSLGTGLGLDLLSRTADWLADSLHIASSPPMSPQHSGDDDPTPRWADGTASSQPQTGGFRPRAPSGQD